jgi:hypothetical protein
MKGVAFTVFFWIMGGSLLIGVTCASIPGFDGSSRSQSEVKYGYDGISDFDGSRSRSAVKYEYDRIGEVKKHCAFLLSSASELKPEIYSIRRDLGFVDGDWRQNSGDSPILPFDDRDTLKNAPVHRTPLKLASFGVMDVDRAHRTKKSVSVSGFLSMGITIDGSYPKRPYQGTQQFQIYPGHTQLSISFQGIYTETKKNGGERLMCLLGTTVLPSRESDSSDPWDWVKLSQPHLSQDDQILLVLRYPMTFTLTNRTIRGEMKSLNPKSNSKYFDQVNIFFPIERG